MRTGRAGRARLPGALRRGVRRRGGSGSPDAVCPGLIGAVLALSMMLSGCAGPGAAAEEKSPGAALAAIRQVPELLAEAGSSRASTEVQMASGSTRITIHGEGVFDYRSRTGELQVMLPEDPGAERGEPVTELFVPGSLYMKNRGAGVPADKWVRVTIAALPDGNLVTGGATDPITAAALLRGVRSAEDLGEVEVGGEVLRRYRGVTDIADAAEAATDEHGREQLAAAVHGFADTAVPFDAYLDEAGLLRKVSHHFSFAQVRAEDPAAAGADGVAAGRGEAVGQAADTAPDEPVVVTSTTVLHGFGSPVEILMPDPADIFTGAVAVS